MRVKRDLFLNVLESVSAGIAQRENIEQGSCFVFSDGDVMTFNDEIACRRKSPIADITGAVRAAPLLALISKLPDEEVDISAGTGELLVRGANKRAGITMEANILLPVGSIDVPQEWRAIDSDFSDAVNIVRHCVGDDDANNFLLTCMHLTDTYIEGCDNFQICRYPFNLSIGDVLVRGTAIKSIVGLDMTEISLTDSWLHFRNPAGLQLSIRRFREDYPDISPYLAVEGAKASLPGGLSEAVEKAEVFSSETSENRILVDLQPGRLIIEGRGSAGWYQEKKQIVYNGEPIKFLISPKLLVDISKRATDCIIAPGRLIIDSGKFVFVGCLAQAAEVSNAAA